MKHRVIWSSVTTKKLCKKNFYQSIFLYRDTATKTLKLLQHYVHHISQCPRFQTTTKWKNIHHCSCNSSIVEEGFFLTSANKTGLHKFVSLPYVFYSVLVHTTYTKLYGWKNKAMQMNDRNYRKKHIMLTTPPKPSKIQKTQILIITNVSTLHTYKLHQNI